MTRHKTRAERIEEILGAAATEIDENGLAALTMDAIVARTSLSKGGVYRFFCNKREVTLALWSVVLQRWSRPHSRHALERNRPLVETLLELILPAEEPLEEDKRDRRIWIELLPLTVRDRAFAEERDKQRRLGRRRYRELIRTLVRRAGLRSGRQIEAVLERTIMLGAIFGEGLTLASVDGEGREELRQHLRSFIEATIVGALGRAT